MRWLANITLVTDNTLSDFSLGIRVCVRCFCVLEACWQIVYICAASETDTIGLLKSDIRRNLAGNWFKILVAGPNFLGARELRAVDLSEPACIAIFTKWSFQHTRCFLNIISVYNYVSISAIKKQLHMWCPVQKTRYPYTKICVPNVLVVCVLTILIV